MTAAPPRSARILYVEDDERIAAMCAEVLREHYVVEHVVDVATARRRLLAARFDALVVDRRLPDGDGLEVVTAVRAARLTTPILLLTALDAVRDRVEGLDAGANDHLAKPFDFDELLARIRALLRGFRAAGARREIGAWTLLADTGVLYGPDGLRATLTPTEAALLAALAESPEHVFSRDELRTGVLPRGEAAGTIEAIVHHVRRKSDEAMIETVRGLGYRIGSP